jgi:predicted transcriptional regulator
MSERTHLSIRIDKDLLKDLKIIAIQQDTSVTGILLDFIEQYVEEHKK